jgi:hypothetical protein
MHDAIAANCDLGPGDDGHPRCHRQQEVGRDQQIDRLGL